MMTEKEFLDALISMPTAQPIQYRLYYNEDGMPIVYTMEDLPGQWIEIDRETYVAGLTNVRVIQGKIKKLKLYPTQKLVPSVLGTACHHTNVAVVDPNGKKTWSKQIYVVE